MLLCCCYSIINYYYSRSRKKRTHWLFRTHSVLLVMWPWMDCFFIFHVRSYASEMCSVRWISIEDDHCTLWFIIIYNHIFRWTNHRCSHVKKPIRTQSSIIHNHITKRKHCHFLNETNNNNHYLLMMKDPAIYSGIQRNIISVCFFFQLSFY